MTRGSVMKATTRITPRQRGQTSGSTSYTRRKSRAHPRRAYGERTLFSGLDLLLGPGSRVGLIGPNGCGKSTLLRVLLGTERPDAGKVTRADGLSVALFEQGRDSLDPEATVRETVCPEGDQVEYRGRFLHVRSWLDRFLFAQEQAEMKVARLSGGEQARLLMARLMLRPAQLLVFDPEGGSGVTALAGLGPSFRLPERDLDTAPRPRSLGRRLPEG